MKKMTEVWSARHVKAGEKAWMRANIRAESLSTREGIAPSPNGAILCEGRVTSTGMDSEWDWLICVRYKNPLSKRDEQIVFSESDPDFDGCFFVER